MAQQETEPSGIGAWRQSDSGEPGFGDSLSCELHDLEPAPGGERTWRRLPDASPPRIVFQAIGVIHRKPGAVERGRWSIGPVYVEREGRRDRTLAEMAEWWAVPARGFTIGFGGKFEARYRAVIEHPGMAGWLFEEGRTVGALSGCEVREQADLPPYEIRQPD